MGDAWRRRGDADGGLRQEGRSDRPGRKERHGQGRARARHCGDEGHRRGGVRLRAADRDELRGDERIRRGQEFGAVQGAVQHDQQRSPRVHVQGHGRRHAQQRHAVFDAVARPARGADGRLGAGGAQAALLLRAADRRERLQLRLHRQPRDGRQRRRLHGGRPRLERRDARGHQEGLPVDDAVRAHHLPHAALQCRRHAERGEGAGRLQGAAAVRVPEAARAAGRAEDRLRPGHDGGNQGELLRVPRRGSPVRPRNAGRQGDPRQARHASASDRARPSRSRICRRNTRPPCCWR